MLARSLSRSVASQDFLEDAGDFKDGVVRESRGIFAESGEVIALEEGTDRGDDLKEVTDHDADFFFADPLGVVALLRERPGVALDDNRETHGDGFADTAGTGLADEKIREVHVVGNARGETFDKNGDASFAGAKPFGEGFIFAADENELEIEIGAVQAVNYLFDYFGALSTEHDQAGG